METLTFDQLRQLPAVVDLTTAARALGIGRTKAYQLAQSGEFPCRIIHVGRGYHIPTAELLKTLGITPRDAEHTGEEGSGKLNESRWISSELGGHDT